jgi:UrcA family protein
LTIAPKLAEIWGFRELARALQYPGMTLIRFQRQAKGTSDHAQDRSLRPDPCRYQRHDRHFAIGMAPMAAHAAAIENTAEVSAPVEHVEVDENGVPSLRVSYAGLDMSNAQDRAEMNHRIARAATRVCAPLRENTVEADRSIAYQNCRSDAIAQGQAGIDGLTAR